MIYRKAKKLHNGDTITVLTTGEQKTVQSTTVCYGKYNKKYIDILCIDGTAYYNFQIQ